MHYSTIITVDIPPIEEEDWKTNEEIQNSIVELKKEINETKDDILLNILLREAMEKATTFSREVSDKVSDKMERYCSNTDNPDYLEFEDLTEGLTKEYNAGGTLCIQFPNGLIVPRFSRQVCGKYTVEDGKVYQKNFGPFKQKKRTKKSRRLKVLEDYPFQKLYKSYEQFVEDYYGYPYFEEHKAFGYYTNPDGYFDWYQVGGRWPDMFLVKNDCRDYSEGSRSWYSEGYHPEAPEGYRWVCAARKRDIQWEAMYDWKLKRYSDSYYKLQAYFRAGTCGDIPHYRVTERGITSYGALLYEKGQSLEEFLKERGFKRGMTYPVNIYSFLDDDGWQEEDRYLWDEEKERYMVKHDDDWSETVDRFLSSLDDETVLVGADIHQ